MQLFESQCTACQVGAPTVSPAEESEFLSYLNDWEIIEEEGVRKLQKVYKFQNFSTAWEFTSRVAEIAEAQGHHPAVLTEWGKVTVTWYTHKIGGLHKNDFIMAGKMDEV